MIAKFAWPRLLIALVLAMACFHGPRAFGQFYVPAQYTWFTPLDTFNGPGYLEAVKTNNYPTNSADAWIGGVSAKQSNGWINLTFTIEGGSNGSPYDVFAAPALDSPLTNADWEWMGQGYSGVTYVLPEFLLNSIYLLLGTPQDSDGDGLTDAYELLVSRSNPYVSNSINPSMLDSWAVLSALNPFAIYDQPFYPNGPEIRLDHWRFNTNSFQSENGLLPLTAYNISIVPGWSGTAVLMTNPASWLSYPAAESNGISFNPGSGTMRFWYMPLSSSGDTNHATFFETLFTFSYGGISWNLSMINNEDFLNFNALSNEFNSPFYYPQYTQLRLQSNLWYQLTITYSPSNFAIYTNGAVYATSYLPPLSNGLPQWSLGNGMIYGFSPTNPAATFSLGNNNNPYGGVPVNGLLDELETFNYSMTPQEVAAGFPTFAGETNNVMTDSDYDGRSDLLEILIDGTNPNDPGSVYPCRLGHWRFDADNFIAEQGQTPLSYYNASLVPGISGTALNISANPASQMTYWDVFTNGWANINCRCGSLRLWFKPNWTGAPPAAAPLVYMGNSNSQSSEWSLRANPDGSVTFVTASNSVAVNHFTTSPLTFDSGHWLQLVLTYGPDATALYTNGALAATGSPMTHWPDLEDRNLGMVIGNSTAYTNSINGQFDEIETFNYELPFSDISSNFSTIQAIDSDLDGIPDLLEDLVLPVSRPYLGVPVVITGAIEAEQFDLGGPGVGYYNIASNPLSSYRPSGMFITNCDDLGLGYCLDQTRAGEWTQYTIDVLVPQPYTIETRAEGIGTNGVFECEFTNNGFYTNTGPLTITSTNWTNVSAVVQLTNGTYNMRLRFLTNGTDGQHVGRFNYISIYPWWQTGFISTYTNAIAALRLSTNNDFKDAAQNSAVIQEAINTLPAGGGTVLLPAGTYFLSQTTPNEGAPANQNAALSILTNNVEFAGAGKTNTTLIAYNRATTVLYVGASQSNLFAACTNVTLRDMTIEAQPHLAVFNVTNTLFEKGQLIRPLEYYNGAATLFASYLPNQFTQNILVTNCQFLFADFAIVIPFAVSNFCLTHCDFIIWGGTNIYTRQVNSFPTNTPNTESYNGSVGMFAADGVLYNAVITENTYNGNTNLIPSTVNPLGYVNSNYTQVFAPDGFVLFQGAGNFFVGRNTILNNDLEGVQLNSGPNAVVGNTYHTLVNVSSCCALAATRNGSLGASGSDPINYWTCFIGNSIYGCRHGASPQGSDPSRPYNLNFSGNEITVFPPLPLVFDSEGSAVSFQNCATALVCGNTMDYGGDGVDFLSQCGNALIVNNNFGNAAYRGIGSDAASVQSAAVFNNILGEGATFHVEFPAANTFSWFLWHNQYLNPAGNPVPPFFDPLATDAHYTK